MRRVWLTKQTEMSQNRICAFRRIFVCYTILVFSIPFIMWVQFWKQQMCYLFFIQNRTGLLGITKSHVLNTNTLFFIKSTTLSFYTNVDNCDCVLFCRVLQLLSFRQDKYVFANTEQHIQRNTKG